MADQIRAVWGNFVGFNLFALALIGVAARWPKVARGIFSVFFLGAGVWNLYASLTMPAFYVETYGPLATPPYAWFIYGPFAVNPAAFVVPIALGQLTIGALAAGTGGRVRLAMAGIIGFLLAIAPMGVGSAFPFSLFGIVAAYLLFRRTFTTSLVDDVTTKFAALAATTRRHGHARPRP